MDANTLMPLALAVVVVGGLFAGNDATRNMERRSTVAGFIDVVFAASAVTLGLIGLAAIAF